MIEYSILERVQLLITNAEMLALQLEAQGIQLPTTMRYQGSEVYVSLGYKDDDLRVNITRKKPCDSVPTAASVPPGLKS